MSPPFRGIGPALVTPLTADDQVDLARFSLLVERAIEGGVDFLVPCGTTGESAALSGEEQASVIRRTVEVSAGRVPVLAGAGSNSTRTAVALSQGAREAGADGLLIVTPYYNKPSPAGLLGHYGAIAEVGLPVIAYNVPGRTGSNVQPPVILDLAARIPALCGVKEAAGRLDQFTTLLEDRAEGFLVLSGDDDLAVDESLAGGDGLISVVANEDPAGTSRMIHAALEGEADAARAELARLLPLIEANFVESNPGPVKYAMSQMGLLDNRLRLPLAPVTELTAERVDAALRGAGLIEG